MATKVGHVRLTPFSVSHRTPGERAPLILFDRISLRFGRAATAGDDGHEGHEDGVNQAVAQQRSIIMFSGITGEVVASGLEAGMSMPTYGLAKHVIKVVDDLEKAHPELFDRHAKHRPCGLLDKYGAEGMLIGDVLGLPLIPWVLAEPIGKRAAKLVKEIPNEIKKALKKAKRNGGNAEAAAAAVLRRCIILPMPSFVEIEAETRRQARASRSQVPPPPPPPVPPPPPAESPTPPLPPPSVPLPSTTESTPEQVDYTDAGDSTVAFWATARHPEIPGYRGRPGGDEAERFWNPERPPCVPSDHRPANLFNSREAAEASGAAGYAERVGPRPDEDGVDEYFCEETYEVACVKHKHALCRLRAAFPEVDGEDHLTRPCPCGRGSLAVWPWVVQTKQLGFCDCDMACWELTCWRGEWIAAGYPSLAY